MASLRGFSHKFVELSLLESLKSIQKKLFVNLTGDLNIRQFVGLSLGFAKI
jgi:hypothetical protein